MPVKLPELSVLMEQYPLPAGISWYPGNGRNFFQPYTISGDYRGEVTAYLVKEAQLDGTWKFQRVMFYLPFDSAQDVKDKIKKGAEALAS